MKSRIFYTEISQEIEARTKDFLNSQDEFLSSSTASNTRAVGDAIQSLLEASFASILGNLSVKYSSGFARRAMADLAFEDQEGFYYVVDVKTHRIDTHFNMPNLTSVDRLARFYEDDKNYFVLLLISYHIETTKALITDVKFIPIEFLGWDCLTIGALGWGQIQISNSNIITINQSYSRRTWMLELCDVLLEFYPKEIAKIGRRMTRFEAVKQFWLSKLEE
ncbi:MAG TPA: hypothetical protein VKA60_11635 [Blastocatellia bacterium]|nr:hypothetical protein [Blastocatellia bacterium]